MPGITPKTGHFERFEFQNRTKGLHFGGQNHPFLRLFGCFWPVFGLKTPKNPQNGSKTPKNGLFGVKNPVFYPQKA